MWSGNPIIFYTSIETTGFLLIFSVCRNSPWWRRMKVMEKGDDDSREESNGYSEWDARKETKCDEREAIRRTEGEGQRL
jgi:hypothetical protein